MTDMKTLSSQPRKPRRAAPAKKSPKAAGSQYPFASLDEILRLSDEQVLASFTELGVEPKPFRWWADDEQLCRSHWTPMDSTEEPIPLKTLHADALAEHNSWLRTDLLGVYVSHWVEGLSDSQLVAEIERIGGDKLSVSEIRYAKVADMRERVSQLVWPELVKESTLYVPVVSPLAS